MEVKNSSSTPVFGNLESKLIFRTLEYGKKINLSKFRIYEEQKKTNIMPDVEGTERRSLVEYLIRVSETVIMT